MKISALNSDLSQWAENFVANLPEEKRRFSQVKSDLENSMAQASKQRQMDQTKESGKLFPIYSFAVKFFEESIAAYALKDSKKNISFERMKLSDNLFGGLQNNIHIQNEVEWHERIGFGLFPMAYTGLDMNIPFLKFEFVNFKKPGGGSTLCIMASRNADKIYFDYTSDFPEPAAGTINGEFEVVDYEGRIKDVIQRVLAVQLLQLEE